MAGLFIRWLNEFTHLEDAGYITVAFVGLRLLARVVYPSLVPPEWVMISLIAIAFIWGFSERVEIASEAAPENLLELNETSEKSVEFKQEETVEFKK
jgi:predicted tellurium resistance membrane protein TerC